ncbi:4,5-DOPA dioxygenase extradiol [Peredibacter sp. HCB2-198]|uniref:4,5-DOPA-extradiol-dioxygenase n=1 Tax=Peredibacter sp. HCB2-198 TaxID=3383025 RepID=UPI0038B60273
MNRRLFIGTLIGGAMGTVLFKNMKGESPRMPTLFLAHGSPMNAIADNSFTRFLSNASSAIPTPRAILVISAHWETLGSKVLKLERPKTIHDFGGFPEPLYQIQYPAPGDVALADRITKLSSSISTDSTWGLDHGTWSVLKFLYPKANVPVLQLSLNRNMTFNDHLSLAKELAPLRDEGVLIVGSGNVTHNLRRISWTENAPATDWALEFDELLKNAILKRDEDFLLGKVGKYQSLWNLAHPSAEHYLPILYAYGAADAPEKVDFIFEGMQNASLSMRSMMFT